MKRRVDMSLRTDTIGLFFFILLFFLACRQDPGKFSFILSLYCRALREWASASAVSPSGHALSLFEAYNKGKREWRTWSHRSDRAQDPEIIKGDHGVLCLRSPMRSRMTRGSLSCWSTNVRWSKDCLQAMITRTLIRVSSIPLSKKKEKV